MIRESLIKIALEAILENEVKKTSRQKKKAITESEMFRKNKKEAKEGDCEMETQSFLIIFISSLNNEGWKMYSAEKPDLGLVCS